MTSDTQKILEFVRAECDRLNIDPYRYGLGDDHVAGDGQMVLTYEEGRWLCYVAERGQRYSTASFEDSFDAIGFFVYKLVINDQNRIMPLIDFAKL